MPEVLGREFLNYSIMKVYLNLTILSLLCFCFGCTKDIENKQHYFEDNLNVGSHPTLSNSTINCVRELEFTFTINGHIIDLNLLGVYHNELLFLLKDSVVNVPCSSNEISTFNTLINNTIDSDNKYNEYFHPQNFIGSNYFDSVIELCNITSESELMKNLDEVLHAYIDTISLHTEVNEFEINLLSEIIDSLFTVNSTINALI